MSEEYQRIELITGTARRRHWSTEAKLRIIEESFEPGETVSSAARRNGVAPNLLYRWRRLLSREVRQLWIRTNLWSAVRNSGVFRSGCANWNACSAARPWRTRSSGKRSPSRRQKN